MLFSLGRGAMLSVLAVLGSSAALSQTTIVEVSGPPSAAAALNYQTDAIQWLGFTWSQTFSATNIAISAPLGDFFAPNPTVRTGTAYLTRQTGPGTTVASEVARATFQVPAETTYTEVRLFSLVTLGPGTYFLILVPTQGEIGGTGWIETASPTTTLAAGAADVQDFFVRDDAGTLNFLYPPASTFVPFPPFDPNHLLFKVFIENPTTQTLVLAVTQIGVGSGQRNSLLVKLNAAQESLAAQNYAAAINQLRAFIHEVEAFNRSRLLDAVTADSLIATARAIIATIP